MDENALALGRPITRRAQVEAGRAVPTPRILEFVDGEPSDDETPQTGRRPPNRPARLGSRFRVRSESETVPALLGEALDGVADQALTTGSRGDAFVGRTAARTTSDHRR